MTEKQLKEQFLKEMKRRGLLEQEEIEQEQMNNEEFCDMVSRILHSRSQVHVFHLQTESYAEHKSLNDYYDSIGDLYDGLVESYQGKYGIITKVKSFEIEQYESNQQIISYFMTLSNEIESRRTSVEDSYLQNQIDTVLELIFSTLYKLRFLK
jgi:hypothetical protein